jgi:hypothetical protein
MGLYEAINTLPSGKRLQYQGADGTTGVLDVEVTATGTLYTVLRNQRIDATGKPRVTSRGYAICTRADCRVLEQSLRDLGINPDNYSVI